MGGFVETGVAGKRWYREFSDLRRDRDVDAQTQLARLRQAADWIEEDFGPRPLFSFIPPGHAISGDVYTEGEVIADAAAGQSRYVPPHIAETYTYKLAAEAGYGLALDTGAHYLGRDYVISLGMCTSRDLKPNFARHVPAVYYFHDRDLSHDAKFVPKLLKTIDADAYFMSITNGSPICIRTWM